MDLTVVDAALTKIANLINELKDKYLDYNDSVSLTEVSKLSRVEPLTILSRDCLNLDIMPDVNQSLLSLFSAYYLQAVDMMSSVKDIEVIKLLDSLNPNRDETGFLLTERASRESLNTLALENYKFDLPKSTNIALEFDKEKEEKLVNISNLSVGKLLNVTIKYKHKDEFEQKVDKEVTVPISVRLIVSAIPNESIIHLLGMKTEDTNVVERFHAWRSGRISFIKDLIFCQDLIDEYKKAMVKDSSGTIQEIMRRVNNSKAFGLLTRNPSLASASNLFVITEENARQLEAKLGGPLRNPRIRQRAFDSTYAMIITVIDRDYERVTFYTRNINSESNFSYKEIKNAAKGKGPDIADMIKLLQLGQAPSF